jgi:hypothetical protein
MVMHTVPEDNSLVFLQEKKDSYNDKSLIIHEKVKNDLNMTNDKHVRQESDIYHRDR